MNRKLIFQIFLPILESVRSSFVKIIEAKSVEFFILRFLFQFQKMSLPLFIGRRSKFRFFSIDPGVVYTSLLLTTDEFRG